MPLKNANAGTDFVPVTEDIEGSDGTISKVGFTYPKNWKYERDPGPLILSQALRDACLEDPDKCIFGDMLARSVSGGDNAYVTGFVAKEGRVEDVPFLEIRGAVFGKAGKFGAYGAPDDVKVLSDSVTGGLRLIEVRFDAFTPGGATLPKRGVLALAGSSAGDAYVLVATTTAGKFKASEATLRAVAQSLRVEATGVKALSDPAAAGKTKSMFAKDNAERAELDRQRREEGLF